MSDTGGETTLAQEERCPHTAGSRSYEEAVAAHRWDVPERYNIAQDVCDKHPPEKLAMVWEDFRGNEREVTLGRAPGREQPARERPSRARRRGR